MSADGFPVPASSRERSLSFAIRFAVLGRHKPSCNVLFAIAIGRGHPPLIRHLGNTPSQLSYTQKFVAPIVFRHTIGKPLTTT
ncbi:uncharacterized protein ARMOST_11181 [Armillaria ostoyae]|uniref:Uncharacterized protein n=1 Tax=Armillaria ostoyae TaxID=47428 RepID=A0A284RGF2_ARMOS|nr:uncharacterized protein ARMOST_11181 [Armillaria ostoyae]